MSIPYKRPRRGWSAAMRLLIERRPVILPEGRPCQPDEIRARMHRANPPMVVHHANGARFKVRRRVFLEAEDVRVECENDAEVWLACRLRSKAHNAPLLWSDPEIEQIEREIEARNEEEDSEDEAVPVEEQDISLQEWEQMGYKWFRNEECVYI